MRQAGMIPEARVHGSNVAKSDSYAGTLHERPVGRPCVWRASSLPCIQGQELPMVHSMFD